MKVSDTNDCSSIDSDHLGFVNGGVAKHHRRGGGDGNGGGDGCGRECGGGCYGSAETDGEVQSLRDGLCTQGDSVTSTTRTRMLRQSPHMRECDFSRISILSIDGWMDA